MRERKWPGCHASAKQGRRKRYWSGRPRRKALEAEEEKEIAKRRRYLTACAVKVVE